jgi:hypothetical protein
MALYPVYPGKQVTYTTVFTYYDLRTVTIYMWLIMATYLMYHNQMQLVSGSVSHLSSAQALHYQSLIAHFL